MSQMQTRSRKRSQEPTGPANTPARQGREKSSDVNMETVREVEDEFTIPLSTPTHSQRSISNGRSENGINGDHNGSSQRPLSPASLTRAQERAELQQLNSRLSVVMSARHKLENENSVLHKQLATMREENDSLLETQIRVYKTEADDLHKRLNEEANARAQEAILRGKAEAELAEQKQRADQDAKRADNAEKRAKNAEAQLRDVQHHLENVQIALRDKSDQCKVLDDELKAIRAQLKTARENLENETKTRVSLENDLDSARAIAEREITLLEEKLKRRTITVVPAVDVVDSHVNDTDDHMADLRERIRDAVDEAKEEFALLHEVQMREFDNQIFNLRQEVKDYQKMIAAQTDELRESRQSNISLQTKIRDSENSNLALQKSFDAYREQSDRQIAEINRKWQEASQKYQQMSAEHRELTDTNRGIKQELDTYNRLVNELENRVDIEYPEADRPRKRPRNSSAQRPSFVSRTPSTRSLTTRTVKTSANKSIANGPVRIIEVDNGKIVRLENTTDTAFPLAGCRVEQAGQGTRTPAKFEFDENSVIAPKSIVSLYSSTFRGEIVGNGSTEILMDSNWISARSLMTSLFGPDNEVLACYETSSETVADSPPAVTRSASNRSGFLPFSPMDAVKNLISGKK